MPRQPITLLTFPFTTLLILILSVNVALAQHWTMVDDTDPAIQYSPAANWFQGPCGSSCKDPNLTNVHNETWHVTQPGRSSGTTRLSLQFTGYSLVVGALLDNVDSMHTSVTIDLDGNSLDYYHDSQQDGTIQTNAVIYYKDGLTYTLHTLTITVYAESIFMLDYIAFQDSLTNTPGMPPSSAGSTTGSPSSSPSPSQSGSSRTSSLSTTSVVSVGPSGMTTIPITFGVPPNDTQSRATTTFDPSTFSLSNVQQISVELSTTVDSSGHTLIIPIRTVTDWGSGYSTGTASHNNSSSGFSPALAGTIGAAVAAVSAALIVIFLVCMRRRKTMRPRPSSTEPYMLANSTPSSQNSSLTPRLSPMPYPTESVLGLFTVPQGPDHHAQPDFLLSSPPPNHSLMSPMTPNLQYYPSQNITATTPSSEQYLNPYGIPYSNSNSLTTPISPNHPQPYYSSPTQSYYQYPVDKLSRHPSNNYLSAQRNMAELRSPVTPLIPRPADWNIESQSEPGEAQQTGAAFAPHSPAMFVASPAILTPTPPSPRRRRSGRQKEIIDELQPQHQPPPPPVPRTGNYYHHQLPNVPILGHPSALRRARRRTDGAEMNPRGTARSPTSDEGSLPPVVRRQSFSHPAPPAYSPPRLVRNTDLHDVLLD